MTGDGNAVSLRLVVWEFGPDFEIFRVKKSEFGFQNSSYSVISKKNKFPILLISSWSPKPTGDWAKLLVARHMPRSELYNARFSGMLYFQGCRVCGGVNVHAILVNCTALPDMRCVYSPTGRT
jgi:hypothetical protein